MAENLHLAIIPDGNRRWAKKRSLFPWKGHEVAVENFRTITNWCRDNARISTLTVWCFSTENWKRDPKEISKLMKMLEQYLRDEREDWLKKNTRFVHSGRKDRIPASLSTLIAAVEDETKDKKGFTLHLAVDYGGKDEVTRAINRLHSNKPINQLTNKHSEVITEEILRTHLDHPEVPDIDLIVRTSGEFRTSNFFLWQSTYAEWVFSEKLFPDLDTDDLAAAVEEYDNRKRRFGS